LLAVADQGLFALTNFGVSVLLARWLPQRDYGTFAVAFSALLLMGTVHTALLTEPMLVLGPSRYRGRTASYVHRLAPLHLRLTAGMSAVLLVGLLLLGLGRRQVDAAATLAALAVASPMPEAAPVTSATLPVKFSQSFIVRSSLSFGNDTSLA